VSTLAKEREIFARTIRALQPYADEVVLIGGWVHALYIAEADASTRAVYTTDIDVTVPRSMMAGDRASLMELVERAGFERDELDAATGLVALWQQVEGGGVVDLDLLTDAPDPKVPVPIEGQPGLVLPGYPDQHVLRENARWIECGGQIHASLHPPLRIRVPTLAAYVLGKALSSARRPGTRKQAKDLVYLFEIVRDREMRTEAVGGMADLAGRHPDEYARGRAILEDAARDRLLLAAVADQLSEQVRMIGEPADIATHVAVHLRRLVADIPSVTV
jgi:hypothetical protein